MEPRFNIYCTGHTHSSEVCKAIAQGTKFKVLAPVGLAEGGVVAYGFLRGIGPLLKQAQKENRPWVYADRGYLRATYGTNYSGYFRLTRNAFQHSGMGEFGPERFERLCLKVLPWRRGNHVLVCPPGDVFTQYVGGFTAKGWLDSTMQALRQYTKRELRVRYKPAAGQGVSLEHDLQDCHALVTYMSNTAVEAVLQGVPVFVTGASVARPVASGSLSMIEQPRYPSRERWLAALAANQWTLDEIRQGKANHLFL